MYSCEKNVPFVSAVRICFDTAFSCILLWSYLLDAEMKEVEESSDVDLGEGTFPVDKEMSDDNVEYKVA